MNRFDLNDGRKIVIKFIIIGVGATGSHFFRGLCQDLRAHLDNPNFMHSPEFSLDKIILIDGDVVERKNIRTQLFTRECITEKKVHSLSERYGDHYGIEVIPYPEYINDHESLHKICMLPDHNYRKIFYLPVIIGMVDNNATRVLLHEYFYDERVPNLIYIDTGVESVRSTQNNDVIHSGFGGQVVTGFKYMGDVFLDPVGDVYPNVLDASDSPFPGCGVQSISSPQHSPTNKTAAQYANNIINNLLHTKSIYQHMINFNIQYGGSSPVLISDSLEFEFNECKQRAIKGHYKYGQY
ncbi:ThiF family adenylyltransferase [Paenibacillus tepidiphilus]|uniref:ThiF family adenylyltransferase n=1 Tax=Paenibacillus tepidiphilus TaxID=2608683 RepID=UPI0013A55741|nr:ThiF family adenylyltransferase [Paenibacillus tepidiphilus]